MADNKTKNKTYNKAIVYCIDLFLILLLFGLDQFTKKLAVDKLMGNKPFVLIDGVLEFDYLENAGSAFGMFQNQKVFILFMCVIFLLLVLFVLIKLPDKMKYIPTHIYLSMIIAGGLGNMFDRIRFDYVIDFISFVLIHFPVFNFADCCVVVAVFGLFIMFVFVYKESDLDFLSFKQKQYREL